MSFLQNQDARYPELSFIHLHHQHLQSIYNNGLYKLLKVQNTYCEVYDKVLFVFLHSIHLTCWLDLEQYRRTPQKDEVIKQKRSSNITTKYLNRKYFFGPDSPASAAQQNDVRQYES